MAAGQADGVSEALLSRVHTGGGGGEQVMAPVSALTSAPAPVLTRSALTSKATLDFPQVTEICERLEVEPAELKETVRVIVGALGQSIDTAGPSTSKRHHLMRAKLRALTIANEMMYSRRAVEAFRATAGFRDILQQLKALRGSELGEVTDSNVRMLASEVDRAVFAPENPERGTSSATAGGSDFWSQTGSIESNLERLERAGQRAQKTFQWASKKVERTVESAANKLLQEAERTFGATPPPSSQQEPPVARRRRPIDEDEQLEWAINASLMEAERRLGKEAGDGAPAHEGGAAAAAMPELWSHSGASAGGPEASRTVAATQQLPLEEVRRRIDETLARTEAAKLERHALARRVRASVIEDGMLVAQLEESEALLAGLAESVQEAETLLQSASGRRSELERKLTVAAEASSCGVGRLQARIAELEAAIVAVGGAVPPPAPVPIEAPAAVAPAAVARGGSLGDAAESPRGVAPAAAPPSAAAPAMGMDRATPGDDAAEDGSATAAEVADAASTPRGGPEAPGGAGAEARDPHGPGGGAGADTPPAEAAAEEAAEEAAEDAAETASTPRGGPEAGVAAGAGAGTPPAGGSPDGGGATSEAPTGAATAAPHSPAAPSAATAPAGAGGGGYPAPAGAGAAAGGGYLAAGGAAVRAPVQPADVEAAAGQAPRTAGPEAGSGEEAAPASRPEAEDAAVDALPDGAAGPAASGAGAQRGAGGP